jgi:hypothetical protein
LNADQWNEWKDSFDKEENHRIQGYLLLGYNKIFHTDGTIAVQQTVRQRNRRIVQTVTTTRNMDLNIDENDYTIGLRLKHYNTTVITKFIKSTYDQDTFQTSRTGLAVTAVPDLQQTYPNQVTIIKVNQDLYSWLWVHGTYINEQFKFGQTGIADSFTLGTGIGWKMLEWFFEYTRYLPSDSDPANYFSLDLTLKFG